MSWWLHALTRVLVASFPMSVLAAPPRMHTHACTHMFTCMYTHMHPFLARTRQCTRAHTCAHTQKHKHPPMHPPMHTHTICTHTCVHTHVCTPVYPKHIPMHMQRTHVYICACHSAHAMHTHSVCAHMCTCTHMWVCTCTPCTHTRVCTRCTSTRVHICTRFLRTPHAHAHAHACRPFLGPLHACACHHTRSHVWRSRPAGSAHATHTCATLMCPPVPRPRGHACSGRGDEVRRRRDAGRSDGGRVLRHAPVAPPGAERLRPARHR